MLKRATQLGAKELLVLTGERPDAHPEVARRLAEYGHTDFTSYVAWTCEQALERGLLPHTNVGVLSRTELSRLREVTASQGLMLESIAEHLVAHQGSPTKEPEPRLQTIRWAGELRIPWTTGILVGIGESAQERFDALQAIAELHRRYGHIQEIIVQNFVPHPRYYDEDPARVADDAQGHGARVARRVSLPNWANPVTLAELELVVTEARRMMPEVGIQIPPNLSDWWPALVAAGATDLGGLSANGDHISPEHPFPSVHRMRRTLSNSDCALTERLCVYPQYLDPDWLEQGVLDVVKSRFWSFIPRGGSGRRAGPQIQRDLVPAAIDKGHRGEPLSRSELTALFAETRPEAIEDLRQAADDLRRDLVGETVTFVVNRNINISNVCVVGCAFCGFGQGRRSPDAYQHSEPEFRHRVREAIAFEATEICMQSGIHPDWTLQDYLKWLVVAKAEAPEIHLHAYSPMEIDAMAAGHELPDVFARLLDAGLGSIPGTAAEVLDDDVRQRISPNKLPVARWVQIVEAGHAAGLRSTSTVMFGHIEEPWELAEHMRVIRGVQERTGGITEFVPLSFIPFQTLLGRTHGIEELSLMENLKHTAVFRLALGRSIVNLQASWVKMGLDAATESLRWGVNDLGGTLMEESISRMAGSTHGTRVTPEQLIEAAHRARRPAAERDTLYELRRHFPLPHIGAGLATITIDPTSQGERDAAAHPLVHE